jgi:hypothetical protein
MNEKKYNPNKAKLFGGVVYVGVVLAATTLFISLVLTAFPEDAYFSRMVMIVAGLMIGASMLAFPLALHTWTIEKNHRTWATVLYYGEMLIVMVNTIVSFMTLLGAYTGYEVPEWAYLYEPFSVGAIVYTLFAWGTVFLMDPEHKRTQSEREADEEFLNLVAQKRMEFVKSIEGENVVMEVVSEEIRERYNPERFKSQRKHFGGVSPAPAPFVKKESEASSLDGEFRKG